MEPTGNSRMVRGRGKNKRVWTAEEDRILVECLQQVATEPKYKQGNTWKNGYLVRVEELMNEKLPSCGLRADPHIDSRWKTMKTKHNAIAEMLSKSGFAWDDARKMVQCEKNVYEEWCQNHKDAKGLWGVPFPLFCEIGELTGKDRATGKVVETFDEALDYLEKETVNETNSDDEDSVSATHSSSKRLKRQHKEMGKEPNEVSSMAAAFVSVSTDFNSFMENINTHLGTMASVWSRADEREQDIVEKSNNVLNELLQLDNLSNTEVLQVANILTAEPNKLRIFYQAPPNLRRQYVKDLLGGSRI